MDYSYDQYEVAVFIFSYKTWFEVSVYQIREQICLLVSFAWNTLFFSFLFFIRYFLYLHFKCYPLS